ncbi:hypothetical protein KUA55_10280 [Enterococcus sp. ALS3]|uniref:Uncharacterized protein n=1 Tax=Enterococcus alishanensis TaxID=1303817 RepID=A0ABS6TDR2_9ENTE|nr:hypothetical protein [Enterococcus alishanensis]MBV7391069.1 hypothetical protein [Enterococcus alishanensis]
MLTINLKVGSYIELQNFQKISFYSEKGLQTILGENLDDFFLNPKLSYNFFGNTQITIYGSDIMFLEFS